MDNEHWKLQIDSGYVTRLCINFVAIPVSRDDLVGLFTGSDTSDNQNPARDPGKHRRNEWPIRWSN